MDILHIFRSFRSSALVSEIIVKTMLSNMFFSRKRCNYNIEKLLEHKLWKPKIMVSLPKYTCALE